MLMAITTTYYQSTHRLLNLVMIISHLMHNLKSLFPTAPSLLKTLVRDAERGEGIERGLAGG